MGLIRVLLALAVVTTHSKVLFGLGFTGLVYGKNAVEMFYTISGFYMALILNQKYTGPGSYRTFIKSRLFRIYPAYAVVGLATCAAGAAVYYASGRLIPLFRYWSDYGPGMTPGTRAYLIIMNVILVGQDTGMFSTISPSSGLVSFFGPRDHQPPSQMFMVIPQAWTIGTELWFYLLAPFLVRQTARLVAVLVATIALRLAMIHMLGLDTPPWSYCFFPTELPFFLFGALGFKAYVALEGRRFPLQRMGQVAFFGMLLLILAFYKIPWRWIPHPYLLLRADLIVFAFPLALPFIFAYTKKNKGDRLIGELSYPIYLTHWIVIDLLRLVDSPWVGRNLGEFTCLFTITFSVILWYFVDRPIDAWRQNLARDLHRSKQEAARPVAH
jgi:peptidoglycan/LPS O-acetylase OafA/YrhL